MSQETIFDTFILETLCYCFWAVPVKFWTPPSHFFAFLHMLTFIFLLSYTWYHLKNTSQLIGHDFEQSQTPRLHFWPHKLDFLHICLHKPLIFMFVHSISPLKHFLFNTHQFRMVPDPSIVFSIVQLPIFALLTYCYQISTFCFAQAAVFTLKNLSKSLNIDLEHFWTLHARFQPPKLPFRGFDQQLPTFDHPLHFGQCFRTQNPFTVTRHRFRTLADPPLMFWPAQLRISCLNPY